MNAGIKAILIFLLNKRKIGGSHTPEKQLITSKTKWLNKKGRKEFENEYKQIINEGVILRLKKRTGKSYDWHISLNPKNVNDLIEKVF